MLSCPEASHDSSIHPGMPPGAQGQKRTPELEPENLSRDPGWVPISEEIVLGQSLQGLGGPSLSRARRKPS
jgi:hypothetical protein